MNAIRPLLIPSLLSLALSACVVGPDYNTPQTSITAPAEAAASNYDRARFEAQWWEQFEDPTLNALVELALDNNRDLAVAFSRLKAARAIRDDVANDRFPTVTSRTSGDFGRSLVPGSDSERQKTESYNLGLDMLWEVDLFGRIQRQLESSEAQIEVAEADFEQLQVSLIAELVDAYGTLRGDQQRERIARDNLKFQKETYDLIVQLRDNGLGDQLDVLRSEANLAATEATIPQLQAAEAVSSNRIATLLGQQAEHLSVDLSPKALPVISKALPVGDPTELLRRRPDIRSAERQLASATADVGVATADLFPRVGLSGFLGFTAGRGSQLGSSAARAWSLSPTISWPAFDLGSVKARLRQSKATAEGALATYEQQVLLALEETSNAFSSYSKSQQRLLSLVRQTEASRAAAEQATLRYREGQTDYLTLLDAERQRLTAEDTQAQAEVDVYSGIVAIYRALGGGLSPQI